MSKDNLNAMPVLELLITAPNEVGILTKITEKIKSLNVNIYGLFGMESKNVGQADLLVITENNKKVQEEITKLGYACGENFVILAYLENKPGSLYEASKKLSDAGINVKHIFATGSIEKTSTAIIYTDNNKKALEVLNA